MRRVRHIGLKLILVVGATAILIISIFAFFNIRSLSTSLLGEVERHANQLSETVKHSTRYDMLLNQRDRIHQTINAIGQQPTIGKIRVLNKTGEIIYSSVANDIGTSVDKKRRELLCLPLRGPAAGTPADSRTDTRVPSASRFHTVPRDHQSDL